MDLELRRLMRAHAAGQIQDEVLLVALARAGHSWAGRRALLEEGMRGVLEDLDATAVFANPTPHPFTQVFEVGEKRLMHQGWRTFRCEEPAGPRRRADVPVGPLVPTHPIEPDVDLSMNDETLVSLHKPDVVLVMRQRRVVATACVWHPSRASLLATHDVDDLRMTVLAELRERGDVLDSFTERFPAATVASWQAAGGKRPDRILQRIDDLDEADLPKESKRVHVRGR